MSSHLSHQLGNPSTVSNLAEADAVDKKVMEQYNHILEIHTFYQELIEDVTNLPYLDDIFP